MSKVIDNVALSRFELEQDGRLAYADYRREAVRLVIPFVYAAPELRGSGTAGRLMEGVLTAARQAGETVVPLCSYAAAYIRRHAEHHDLLG